MTKIVFDTEAEKIVEFDGEIRYDDCLNLMSAMLKIQTTLQQHLLKQIVLRDILLLRKIALYYEENEKSLKEIYSEFLEEQNKKDDEVEK